MHKGIRRNVSSYRRRQCLVSVADQCEKDDNRLFLTMVCSENIYEISVASPYLPPNRWLGIQWPWLGQEGYPKQFPVNWPVWDWGWEFVALAYTLRKILSCQSLWPREPWDQLRPVICRPLPMKAPPLATRTLLVFSMINFPSSITYITNDDYFN